MKGAGKSGSSGNQDDRKTSLTGLLSRAKHSDQNPDQTYPMSKAAEPSAYVSASDPKDSGPDHNNAYPTLKSAEPPAHVAACDPKHSEQGQEHTHPMPKSAEPPAQVAAPEPDLFPTKPPLRGKLKICFFLCNELFDDTCDGFCDNIRSTVAGLVFFTIICLVSIIMIAIGWKYIRECPIQRHIPIYLIAGGCLSAVFSMLNIYYGIRQRLQGFLSCAPGTPPSQAKLSALLFYVFKWMLYRSIFILTLFLMAWVIAGAVWVFQVYKPSFDFHKEPKTNYCHPVVYWFAFARCCNLTEEDPIGVICTIGMMKEPIHAAMYNIGIDQINPEVKCC